MLVTRNDVIELRNLSTARDLVSVDQIPLVFKEDFQNFFFGKTFVKKGNTLFAYPHDVRLWTHYIINKYKG